MAACSNSTIPCPAQQQTVGNPMQIEPPSDSSSSTCSPGTPSFSSDFGSCEGYLVLTFDSTNKKWGAKQAAVANYADRLQDDTQSSNSPEKPPPTSRLSRLAALAAGVDLSQISHSTGSTSLTSNSTSRRSPTSISCSSEYVRRFTYPDGDTHYDWLSCPLAEMQGSGATSVSSHPAGRPLSLAPRKSILVYDSSVPSSNSNISSSTTAIASAAPSYSASASINRRPRFLTGRGKPGSSSARKMLRCEECGKYYGNEYSLHHHICLKRKDVWKKGDVPTDWVDGHQIFFCPVCNKPFKWLGNLTRHYYVHTGQRFFKCDICQKEFFSAYQVRRHMNSHTGLRFQCRICEKPFTCKYACAWHVRQHEIERLGGQDQSIHHPSAPHS